MKYSNCICIMSTLLLGGTHRHYMEMAKIYSFRCHVLLVEYDENFIIVRVSFQGKLLDEKLIFGSGTEKLAYELEKWNIKLIHLHHFMYMNDILRNFLLSGRYRLAVTLHDYYVMCPRVNMTKNGKYCYEACDNECNACMNDSLAEPSGDLECRISRFPDIVSWRRYWFEFLYKADYVFVPSSDQRKRLLRYFPSLTKIRVVENPEIVVPPDTCNVKFRKVGILGAISEAKGRSVLLECARLAEEQHLAIQFVLFGTLSPSEQNLPTNLLVKGRYKEDEVYSLITREGIDFFWFTAIGPETYSYVLTIPIRLGIPVIAADLGAIGERIKRGGWGEVYPVEADISEIVHALSVFDYMHYQSTGDFKIKNDHFLSFQELYCDDKKIFPVAFETEDIGGYFLSSSSSDICTALSHTDVAICGTPSHLQPHELKFLWSKRKGLLWKCRLFWATEKIPLMKKITGKICKENVLGKREWKYGMERSKLFSKESFYMNFVNVIRKIVHFGG